MASKKKVRGSQVLIVSGLIVFFVIASRIMVDMNNHRPLKGEWAEKLKMPPSDLTKYAEKHPLHLKGVLLEKYSLSQSHFNNLRFENVIWIDGFAQDGQITNSAFIGGSIIDTSFAGSRLVNVVFDGVDMREAEFVGAELINVTFRNCKIYNSEIRNLQNSKILIENSELFDVSFFQSLLDLRLLNSKVLEAVEFMGAQPGSSVLIADSEIGPYSDFGGSNFDHFKILRTTIRNSRANGISAGKVVLDRITSDFAIADSTVGSVEVTDLSGVFSLGGTKAVSASIDMCNPHSKIYFDEFIADRLTIRNCAADKLVLDKAVVKELALSNMTIDWLVLDGLKADTLTVHNVRVENRLTAAGAMAGEVPAADWKLQPNTIVEAEGTNIPLP